MRKTRLMLFMAMMAVMSIVSMGAEITFKVDMTVLWNGALPKNVYILPQRTDNGTESDMTQDGRKIELKYSADIRNKATEQEDAVKGAIILTDDDNDGIVEDTDTDGIYEGKVTTTGTHDFNSRLYISKNDDNNNMKNPIYEVRSEGDTQAKGNVDYMGWSKRDFKTDKDKTINWAWEDKVISGFESLSTNANTNTTLELQSGFSQKLVLNAKFTRDTNVNRDVSKFVVLVEGNRDIADIEKVMDDGNVAYVKIKAKGKKGEYTKLGLRVGNPEGTYKIYYINVSIKDATTSNFGSQTLVVKPIGGIDNKNDVLGFDNNLQTINGCYARIAGLSYSTTESIVKSSFSDPYFLLFCAMSYGDGYTWWLPDGVWGNGVIIPLKNISVDNQYKTSYSSGVWIRGTQNSWGLTSMNLVADYTREIKAVFQNGDSNGGARFRIDVSGNWTKAYPADNYAVTTYGTYVITFNEKTNDIKIVKDGMETTADKSSIIPFKTNVKFKKVNKLTLESSEMDIKIPDVVDSSKIVVTPGVNPMIEWSESKEENSNYAERYTVVRICKLNTTRDLTKFDIYNNINPINDAVTDINAVNDFDLGTDAYIDYVFKETGMKISSDGRGVKREEYTNELKQKITIMNFPIGEYKMQLYSIKGNEKIGYSVLTFETEKAFEITREEYEDANKSTEDSYIINDINPSRFNEIAVTFTTRTTETMTADEMKSRIFYAEGNGSALGVKELKKESGVYNEANWKNNSDKLEWYTDNRILSLSKVQADKKSLMPLDIVLCLDRSNSMNIKMETIKIAWKSFEDEMAKKGFSVGYQMYEFYNKGNLNKVTSKWEENLSAICSDKFTQGSPYDTVEYEYSAEAVNAAADFLKSGGGRYYGYNSATGSWGPVATKTNVPSQKVIVFITDANPTYSPGNDLEEKIRDNNIKLIGLGSVKDESGNKLILDSASYTAAYPDVGSKHEGKTAFSYYDLKILLGSEFGWYQISNNVSQISAQLLHGMSGINSTAVWELKYVTPYSEADESVRRVDFYLKNKNNLSITYKGSSSEREYKAPKVEVFLNIKTPIKGGVFDDYDDNNYKVSGTAWAKMTFDNPDIQSKLTEDKEYYPLEGCDLNIKKSNTQADLLFSDVTSGDKKVKTDKLTKEDSIVKESEVTIDGEKKKVSYPTTYSYLFTVAKKDINDSDADEFDVNVRAYTATINNWHEEKTVKAERVKADRDPPKLMTLTMLNNTTQTKWSGLTTSDGKGNVFTSNQAILFSTLKYKPFGSDTNYGTTTADFVKLAFKDREKNGDNGEKYDGRFVKNGDKITITAVFKDENFDTSNWNKDSKNYVSAVFEQLGTGTTAILGTLDSENSKNGNIVVTWSLNVKNSLASDIGKITIEAVDNFRNKTSDSTKTTNKLGAMEIALVDNVTPSYPEWDTNGISGEGKTSLTVFKAKEAVTVTPVITNQPYQLNCVGGATKVDTNGIRAFRVYYTYDYTNSDWGNSTKDAKGKHNADMTMGNEIVGTFYMVAGDGINLSDSGTETNASGTAIKELDTTTYGDDGKYIFKVVAVDKAGNETVCYSNGGIFGKNEIEASPNSGEIAPKTIYVDTQAPVITSVVLRKDSKDNDGICTDNFVKKNDKAYIYADVADYSAVASSVGSYENYYKGTGYPAYRAITMKDETPEIAVSGTQSKTDTEKTKLNLRIGDIAGTNGNYLVVSVMAQEGDTGLVTIGAKDLAGNEAIKTIAPTVDNTIKNPVLKAYSLEGKKKNYTDVSKSIQDIDGAAPTSTNVHFTKHSSYSLDISNVDTDVVSGELVHNTSYKTSGITKNDSDYPVSGTGYLIPNYLNNAKLTVNDKAGNQAESNLAEIVVDTLVGNGNGMVMREATAERVDGNVYKIKMNFSGLGNEYAGIQKYRITGSYAGKYTECGIPDIKGNIPSKAGQAWSISPIINLTVAPDKVGTIIYIPGVLLDNLGNERTFNYKVLIPGKDVRIKSRDEGASKEIRTRVRVIDANGRVDLQQTEETGKDAVKPVVKPKGK